jgi:hypothetical protein
MVRGVATVVAFCLLACGAAGASPALTIDRASYRLVVNGADLTVYSGGKRLLGGRLISGKVRRRWDRKASRLTLTSASATVELRARPTFFDLRLRLVNTGKVRTAVGFPSFVADSASVGAGYAPNVLPGVKLGPAFFSRVGNNAEIYPSRWAFADYLGLDLAGTHVALYSIVPGPIRPVLAGFAHTATGRCSGTTFCVVHDFQTWIKRGARWESPVVRVRIGGDVRSTVLSYRTDSGIAAYPSLQDKLGSRLATLAQAPLIKTNLALLGPFGGLDLSQLPSPVLLHPVGYQPGGHDVNVPDVLPPDSRLGTSADFRALIDRAHARGDVVMPYDNFSWWDPNSPTMKRSQPKAVAVLDQRGTPSSVDYNDRTGVIVSAASPGVRARVAQQLEAWRTDVPADCLFLDQIGARPWLRDFNASAPTPESYYDSWLTLLAPYAGRCLMVEDGWDRLARDFVGFHGSALMMERELHYPDQIFGEGNWEPFPLATWLFHDKVLMYEHDLYDGTMAIDREVLTWNLAFGMVSSYSWDAGTGPWLTLVAELQRLLGPHYAGLPLDEYRELSPGVTQSRFGDLTVVANRSAAPVTVDGYAIAPKGYLARTPTVLAAALTDASGVHYVLVERSGAAVTVRQPVGADTTLSVEPPPGTQFDVTALAASGSPLGSVPAVVRDGRVAFAYAAALDGRPVAAYRVTGR